VSGGWASEGSLILGAVLAYVLLLLLVARHAERAPFLPGRNLARGVSYALSLSVLCSSWTYFGAVGLAMRSGWGFLPNSLGPIIALTLMWPFWRRIAKIAKRENASSIADFIASRYGKSRPLGALIACVAIIGALPYLALQMMALSKATAIILGQAVPSAAAAPLIIAALAGLSILFGARRPTLTQHNTGLTRVVALEALVKLTALVAVAGLALILLTRAPKAPDWGALGAWPVVDSNFLIATMLCTGTVFTLPRVFHMGFVTVGEMSDLKTGRWLFPTYMAIWAIAIVPIAVAGARFGALDPNTVVLDLPHLHGGVAITAIAFLGGVSAGAAMAMVETIALSAMISNELILPWLARKQWAATQNEDVGALIVKVRRVAIVGILALSYLYFARMRVTADLPRLGFSSLAASAQLLPALLGAVTWRGGHARGAFWGIVSGMLVWMLTIALPQLALEGAAQDTADMENIRYLFNFGVCSSLLINLAVYIGISRISNQRLIDRIQANSFLAEDFPILSRGGQQLRGTVGDLRALLQRFLDPKGIALGFSDFGSSNGRLPHDDDAITPALARMAERMLAGAIGASSARNVIALAIAGDERDATDVSHILDEAVHAVHFSRSVIQTAFNAIDQGISVIDGELRLVAWNERYMELFGLPEGEVYVGRPLADLIRLSAHRADMAPEEEVVVLEERLGPIRRRERQQFERQLTEGLIVRVVGRPLGTGEYVTSFTDVTEVRAASRALAQINEELEHRVATRTHELTQVNRALRDAKALAERVTNAQNRFVAAASHDLLQPMHAARLYLGAARESLPGEDRSRQLLMHADLSIEAADRLLKGLLNLSRIEVGGMVPEFSAVDLNDLLTALQREFEPLAEASNLVLHTVPTGRWARSNPDLLRSVLQNLLSNAIRYTPSGRIVVCVRPEGDLLRIEVRDSGLGIANEARELIFREFTRLAETNSNSAGTGLGLAIAQRICSALGHRLAVRSQPGRGSVFSVSLASARPVAVAARPKSSRGALDGLRVLCVEDNPEILKAQRVLLEQWGAAVTSANSFTEALDRAGTSEVFMVDCHLGDGPDGLNLLEALPPISHRLLITADNSDRIRERAAELGVTVLSKPLHPASLRAFLTHALTAVREAKVAGTA
jgi:Na+/proline symporter/signal transduction histidine kinase/CheY-like chemotaxis protein